MQKENLFFLSFLFLDLSIHSQPDFNNKAMKWLVFHIIPSTKKTNHAKSRQTTTNHDSTSSVLRNFAVAKVLPLDHTIKKKFYCIALA